MAEAGDKNIVLVVGIMVVVAVAGIILVLFLNKGYQSALSEEQSSSSNQQPNEINNVIAEKPISQKIAGKSDSTIDACVDFDNGKDYYVKGKAVWRGWQGDDFCEVYNTLGGWTQIDSCIAGDRSCSVAEKYCDSSAPNNIGREDKYCEYGCDDGACLSSPKKPMCTDSDGGLDYYTASQADSSGRTIYDECTSNSTLQEGYCVGSSIPCNSYDGMCYTVYVCPAGCRDGACILTGGEKG